MIKKKFDCVDMKHKGAELTAKKTSSFSTEEELDFWKLKNQELAKKKFELDNKSGKQN